MTQVISKNEWKRRYQERLVNLGGLDLASAVSASEVAIEHAGDWLTPEDAADEEMTHWTIE